MLIDLYLHTPHIYDKESMGGKTFNENIQVSTTQVFNYCSGLP